MKKIIIAIVLIIIIFGVYYISQGKNKSSTIVYPTVELTPTPKPLDQTPPPVINPTLLKGNIAGHINIGPFCPVVREGELCPVPPEAYSSRKVIVYGSNKTTIKEMVNIDKNGDYKVTLTPGTYFLQVEPAGIGPGEKKKVVVISSKTSTVDFDIDTGIR